MKKQLLFLSMFINIFAIGNATDIVFLDANFENALLNGFQVIDTDGSGGISIAEAEAVKYLSVSGQQIYNLSGIENFINLTYLNVNKNRLRSLNVAKNTKLTSLYCYNNKLTSLNVTKNISLIALYCYRNSLNSLDVTKNPNLTSLACQSNNLTSLDVTHNTSLEILHCNNNNLINLDLIQNTELEKLDYSENQLSKLDVSYCALTELDFRKDSNLTEIFMEGQLLAYSIDLPNTSNLEFICGE